MTARRQTPERSHASSGPRPGRPGRAKPTASTPDTLRGEWITEARSIGIDPAALAPDRIADDARLVGRIPDEDLIEKVLLHANDEASSWLRADLARHLATILETHVAPSGVALVDEIDRLATLAETRCVGLGPDHPNTTRRRDGRPVTEHVTDRRLTTTAVLRQEQHLQRWATANLRPVASTADPQASAAAAIAGDERLVLVVGPAGTGKTHATSHAVTALRTAGRPVVGLAPSGKAADVLAREAGCATNTVAGFLTRHRGRPSPWPPGTTVILDEAAMTTTADLARLVELAEQHGWRLAAIGDPHQLPAVGRGGMFAHWRDAPPPHPRATPPLHPTLGSNREPRLARRATRGNRRVHRTRPHSRRSPCARRHARRPSTSPPRRRGTDRRDHHHQHRDRPRYQPRDPTVARSCRSWCRALHDGTSAQIGDQIATRRNQPSLHGATGEQVRNRHTWTVTATHADGALTVSHPDRGAFELPATYVAEHGELGWAVTGYGTQGDTVDIGIAVLDNTASRNHAYVAMTRGRHANHAMLLDSTGTQDPSEQLARIISRPANGESALAVRQRLHHAAGLAPPTTNDAVRTTEPDTPPWTATTLQQEIDKLQQRLDRLQHRTAERARQDTLGL